MFQPNWQPIEPTASVRQEQPTHRRLLLDANEIQAIALLVARFVKQLRRSLSCPRRPATGDRRRERRQACRPCAQRPGAIAQAQRSMKPGKRTDDSTRCKDLSSDRTRGQSYRAPERPYHFQGFFKPSCRVEINLQPHDRDTPAIKFIALQAIELDVRWNLADPPMTRRFARSSQAIECEVRVIALRSNRTSTTVPTTLANTLMNRPASLGVPHEPSVHSYSTPPADQAGYSTSDVQERSNVPSAIPGEHTDARLRSERGSTPSQAVVQERSSSSRAGTCSHNRSDEPSDRAHDSSSSPLQTEAQEFPSRRA